MQRFGYKPLSQNWISETLLDETYINIEDKIETIPKKIFLLNVISDESNNVKDKQILNMRVPTKNHHAFYTLLESAKDKYLDVSKNAYWILAKMLKLTNNDLSKIHRIIINICSLK